MTGLELKKFRDNFNVTQEELAEKLGVSRVTIARWEKSNIIPQAQEAMINLLYQNVSSKYKIDASTVLVNEPTSFIKNKNGLTYEELPNGKYLVEVPKVPYDAFASFIEVFGDEYETKEKFDTAIFTVDHPGKGKYLSFTVRNDSMNGGGINDTPSGAEVLARQLDKIHWKDGFRMSNYGWIIVSHQGIFHKDIENGNHGFIICKSRNKSPEFSDFELDMNEIHSIWKVIKRTF